MRLLLLLALLTVPAWGQALSVGCTKATQGGTATCTGSGGTGPYTYSVSAGSGSIGASDGVFIPPAAVEVKQKLGPCQLLPPDHIYNTRIDGLPIHADSTTIIGRGGTSFRIVFQPSGPFNILDNSAPTFDAVFGYTPLNNGAFRWLDWPVGKIQSGWFLTPYGDEDRHIFAVNRDTCEFSDIYNKYPAGSNPGCPTCNSAGGVKYFSDLSMPTNGATDAAGMLVPPVLLRLTDFQSGTIQHAMRFTMANSRIQSGSSTNWQWPGKSGTSAASCAAPCLKYGMYVRLKSSFDISGYSTAAQMVLTALKHYGMMLTDGGTDWAISTSPDVGLDKDLRAALKEIYDSALRNGDFEVVDMAGANISTSSAAVNLAAITPSQYAEVMVTDATMATATTRVNLAGIVVGTPEPTMTIMAGHTVTPQWWVTGTATQTVTWTMDPDVGTINSSTGEFTPDSGISAPVRTRLTATSTVEATATAVIDVVVWPDNASGNIYADWGWGDVTEKTYDTKTFWRDAWTQAEGWNGIVGQTTAGGDIFTNTRYFLHDTLAKWYLPNGNYKARVYVKSNAYTSSTPVDPDTYKIHYESQGKLIYRNYSIGRATGGLHQTGGYVDLPLKVTDGSGQLAFRHLSEPGGTSVVYISAIAIEADGNDPHLTIDDPTAGANMTIGQTRQFYAIGWYMSDSVTWSVADGPGSIDANGLYTAPSTPPSAPQTIILQATSTVDGMTYAQTSFEFVFGTVTVTGPASVSRGQTAQFSASINGVSYSNVTWSRSGAQGSINSSGLYSAPGSIADATITITATPIDAGGSAGTANLDLVQLINPIRFYANTLSNLTDGNGNVWSTHPGPCTTIGTGLIYTGDPGPISGLPVSGQQNLYIGRFYRSSAGTIGYSCPVPNGIYQVLFKHANAQATDLKSKFNLKLEGITVAANFEPTVAAGAVLTAFDHTYTVVVADGALTIEAEGLSNPPSQQILAMLMGIQIADLGPVGPILGNTRFNGGIGISGGVVIP